MLQVLAAVANPTTSGLCSPLYRAKIGRLLDSDSDALAFQLFSELEPELPGHPVSSPLFLPHDVASRLLWRVAKGTNSLTFIHHGVVDGFRS